MGLRACGPQLLPVCAEAVSKESKNRPSNKLHCFHPGPAVTKELIFSSNIGQHDLDTKSKQVQQWIEKKYHVQVTIKKGKNADQPGNEPVSKCEHPLGLLFSRAKIQLSKNWKTTGKETDW